MAAGPSPIRPHSRPFYSLRIQSRVALTSRLQASRLDRAAGHSLRCSPVFVMFDLVTRLTREYVDQASGDVRKRRRAPEFEALMAC